jgi:DNA-binding SARP family transcriptional activator
MDLQLLGPVEATVRGRPIPLGATKQRALLAILALHANSTVSIEFLVDGLWGEEPPATAPKMVQLYVSQLRRLFADNGAQIARRS